MCEFTDLPAAKDQSTNYITPSQGKRGKLLAINTFIPNVNLLYIPLFNTAALKRGWNKGKIKSVSLHASPVPSAELAEFLSLLLVLRLLLLLLLL